VECLRGRVLLSIVEFNEMKAGHPSRTDALRTSYRVRFVAICKWAFSFILECPDSESKRCLIRQAIVVLDSQTRNSTRFMARADGRDSNWVAII